MLTINDIVLKIENDQKKTERKQATPLVTIFD
jgi:hypothetical protein